MAGGDYVAFEGFDELRRGLKALQSDEFLREFRLAGRNVAVDIIIPAAQGYTSTRRDARAMATLRPASLETGAGVRLGNAATPFALGAEFGAKVKRRRRSKGRTEPGTTRRDRGSGFYLGYRQFEQWTGNRVSGDEDPGFFLWRAIRERSGETLVEFGSAIDRLWDRLNRDLGG